MKFNYKNLFLLLISILFKFLKCEDEILEVKFKSDITALENKLNSVRLNNYLRKIMMKVVKIFTS